MTDPVRTSIGARRNPETEAAVLDAAAAIITECGFAKLTIEAVARRARSGKATIYRWWPGRGHLLLGLYTRAKESMTQPDTGTLRGDLEQYLAAMIRQWQGEGLAQGQDGGLPVGTLFRLLVAEAQTDDTVRAAMKIEREARWHHIDIMVAAAQARGEVNLALSARAIEHRIIAPMWYLLLTDALPPPEAAPALVNDILTGILRP